MSEQQSSIKCYVSLDKPAQEGELRFEEGDRQLEEQVGRGRNISRNRSNSAACQRSVLRTTVQDPIFIIQINL
jgi:hypothetical protein